MIYTFYLKDGECRTDFRIEFTDSKVKINLSNTGIWWNCEYNDIVDSLYNDIEEILPNRVVIKRTL